MGDVVIEELVKQEPWRRGQGQPRNALDPTWNIGRSAPCTGKTKYRAGTDWWECTGCGYLGKLSYRHVHHPINHPHVYLMASILGYIAQRAKEGISRDLSIRQMLHIAGVAIRYATHRKASELDDYVQRLTVD
jgi:hypothetical protein